VGAGGQSVSSSVACPVNCFPGLSLQLGWFGFHPGRTGLAPCCVRPLLRGGGGVSFLCAIFCQSALPCFLVRFWVVSLGLGVWLFCACPALDWSWWLPPLSGQAARSKGCRGFEGWCCPRRVFLLVGSRVFLVGLVCFYWFVSGFFLCRVVSHCVVLSGVMRSVCRGSHRW